MRLLAKVRTFFRGKSSIHCSLLIAKAKQAHNIAEKLIKVVDNVKTFPLCDNTVKDGSDKMAGDCQKKLHEMLENVPFAIQLEESTTLSDESVLLVYLQCSHGCLDRW